MKEGTCHPLPGRILDWFSFPGWQSPRLPGDPSWFGFNPGARTCQCGWSFLLQAATVRQLAKLLVFHTASYRMYVVVVTGY
jgi:hypothetical protein